MRHSWGVLAPIFLPFLTRPSGSEEGSASPGPGVVELMPDALGSGSAFDSLVAAVCDRKWLATSALEAVIPATYRL